jgi:hypothetical protein
MTYKAPTAWSYSRYADHAKCPFLFLHKYILKTRDDTTPAMQRGKDLHLAIARYIGGVGELPDVKHQHQVMKELRGFDDKVIEQQWGFTNQWQQTGWFGNATWYRQICDVAVCYEDMTVETVDWKTGKRYGSNDAQVELQALGIFFRFKPAVHVTSRLAYVDTGQTEMEEFPLSVRDKLRDKWTAAVVPMMTDTEFLPRPNDGCGRCVFSKSNAGPCRFG